LSLKKLRKIHINCLKKIYKHKTEGYLKQGDLQLFKVIRKITIPTNNEYFVLQDLKGSKHLLPFELYENYDIKINSNIKCKIDKINCIGRVFLEPQHIYYKENEYYKFEYIEEIEIIKKNLKKYKYHKFKGKYNFIVLLAIINNEKKFLKKEKYNFKINKISKSIIYLKYNKAITNKN